MWEKDSSLDPISLARVHRGSYYLTSGKMKGKRTCLKDKDEEEEESEVDEEVKEVRENAQLMHATW